jgi:hypothetical protein
MPPSQIFRKTPVWQGTTPQVIGYVTDFDGVRFRPDTLTMTIYDVDFHPSVTIQAWMAHPVFPVPATHSVVNGRKDIDVLAQCDVNGTITLVLDAEDLEIDVPAQAIPSVWLRRIMFTFTWASPERKGKSELVFPVLPDRSTIAT